MLLSFYFINKISISWVIFYEIRWINKTGNINTFLKIVYYPLKPQTYYKFRILLTTLLSVFCYVASNYYIFLVITLFRIEEEKSSLSVFVFISLILYDPIENSSYIITIKQRMCHRCYIIS